MHVETRQLIALRDGEPVDAQAGAHIADCEQCAHSLAELARTRNALRKLPGEVPPEGLWSRISEARELETMTPRRPLHSRSVLVASLALTVMAAAVVFPLRQQETTEPVRQATVPDVASLNGLQQQSRDLEALLQRYRMPAVMSLTTASAINDIEDSIAMIDDRLSEPNVDREQQRLLWERRVVLMEALMTVRAAERRAGSI